MFSSEGNRTHHADLTKHGQKNSGPRSKFFPPSTGVVNRPMLSQKSDAPDLSRTQSDALGAQKPKSESCENQKAKAATRAVIFLQESSLKAPLRRALSDCDAPVHEPCKRWTDGYQSARSAGVGCGTCWGLIGSTEGIQHSPHVRDFFEGVAGWAHPDGGIVLNWLRAVGPGCT